MVRIQQQPAYVLHTRAFRETSLIAELLTRDYGRTAVVARGARGPKSKWRNLLQPFRPLLISWNARTELGTLTIADQVAAPPALHGEALFCGMYLNELLTRLLHRGDPQTLVFEHYRQVLAELAAGMSPQPVLRIFEKNLLEAIGFGLMLDREAGSSAVLEANALYDYRPERGPVRVAGGVALSSRMVRGGALLALKNEQLNEEVLHDLRKLMRRVIRYHLGDKPLASLALFGNFKSKTGKAKRTEHA